MQSYNVRATSAAAPEAVWALLVDAASWPDWTRIDALDAEQSERIDRRGNDGVGTVRAFRTGRVVTKERITEVEPPRLFRYEGVDNPTMIDYTAEVELAAEDAGGTVIRWRGTWSGRPGARLMTQWYMRRFMKAMAAGLAREAETTADQAD